MMRKGVIWWSLFFLLSFGPQVLGSVNNRENKKQKLCSLRSLSPHPRLKQWNLEPGATTVSGISNGGAFAVQISFIFSSQIHGAGIFAASPFPMLYLLSKWNPKALWDTSEYYSVIDELSAKGLIDSTDNLKGFKAFVYKGSRDRIIHPLIVKYVSQQFQHYGADVKDMINQIPSGHCLPTKDGVDDPAIGKYQGICTSVGYGGISDMFSHFYGSHFVHPRNTSGSPTGLLFKSDLSEFYPGCNPEVFGLNSAAWTYVPRRCGRGAQGQKCKLHFAFHGYILPFRARLFANSLNAFVEYGGYLQAADANDIIILFPEANWRGYDVLGYTGPEEFVRKTGVQNQAIKKMIDRVIHGL